jgi:mycothione reductase
MKEYGLIVIGSGAGMNVVDPALQRDLRVAVVEEGPLGGTCLNRGCIPSKVLVHVADVIQEARRAKAIGVDLRLEKVDFGLVKRRMWDIVLNGRHEMEEGVKHAPGIDLYKGVGSFVSDRTLEVDGRTLTAPKIVIASGARAQVPRVPGLDKVPYHTYRTVFDIEERPESFVIMGGGYIGCEFAHFFSAIGTKVTLVGRNPLLLPHEEPETSALVRARLSERVEVMTGAEVTGVSGGKGRVVVEVNRSDGSAATVEGQHLLVATGVRPNSDWLKPGMTGVETDERGWVKTDQYLETSKKGIYALGDALGRNMYRHTANHQAAVVAHNLFAEKRRAMDLHAVPHAVFTDPQVGQVGMTQAEAVEETKVLVGVARYQDSAMGYAYADPDAFVKLVVEYPTYRLLGATAVGPQAALLVQQIVNMMNCENQTYAPLARSQIIHPTLTEVLASALGAMRPVNFKPEEHNHHSH